MSLQVAPRSFRALVAVAALAALTALAGCGGGAPPVAPSAASTTGPDGVREFDVSATDALRFDPASFSVRAGETIRFVVTNRGVGPHEFFVGDGAAQEEHAREMAASGMMHDHGMGIGLARAETKTLEVTFSEPGQMLVGCHVPGHYGAGMRAVIEVTQ